MSTGLGSSLPSTRSHSFVGPPDSRGSFRSFIDADAHADVERQLLAAVQSAGPLRVVLAQLSHWLVERSAWERLGYARLSDYADERLGRSGRSVRDLARVGRVFDGLPALRDALASGRLGWTQVRLVARVATPATLEGWIRVAESVSVEVLARQVRRVDVGSLERGALEAEPVSRLIEISCTPEVRARWAHARSVAGRVHGGRLSQSGRAEIIAAEMISALPIDADLVVAVAETDGEKFGAAEGVAGWGALGGALLDDVLPDAALLDPALRHTALLGTALQDPALLNPALESSRAEAAGRDVRAVPELAPESPCAVQALESGPEDVCGNRSGSSVAPISERCRDGAVVFPFPDRRNKDKRDERGEDNCRMISLPAELACLLDGAESADAFELDRRLRAAFSMEQRLNGQTGPLLASVLRRGVHRMLGFPTRAGYVRERLGLDPSWGRALLRVERAAQVSPAFARAYRSGALTALQAACLVPLVVAELGEAWVQRWVERAPRYTLRRLRDDVEGALLLRELDFQAWRRTGGLPGIEVGAVGASGNAAWETGAATIGTEGCAARLEEAAVSGAEGCAARLEEAAVSGAEGCAARLDAVAATEAESCSARADAVAATEAESCSARADAAAAAGGESCAARLDTAAEAGGESRAAWAAESCDREIGAGATRLGGDAGLADEGADREIGARTTDLETCTVRMIVEAEVAQLWRGLLCSVRRRMEPVDGRLPTNGRALGLILDHVLDAWGALDEKVQRSHRVFARDGWRCVVPGCSSMRNLHDHHVVFRSAGGSDALENRTTLCAFHHLRGVHAGIVRCSGRAPEALRFDLGVRSGREPLVAYAAGDRVIGGLGVFSGRCERSRMSSRSAV